KIIIQTFAAKIEDYKEMKDNKEMNDSQMTEKIINAMTQLLNEMQKLNGKRYHLTYEKADISNKTHDKITNCINSIDPSYLSANLQKNASIIPAATVHADIQAIIRDITIIEQKYKEIDSRKTNRVSKAKTELQALAYKTGSKEEREQVQKILSELDKNLFSENNSSRFLTFFKKKDPFENAHRTIINTWKEKISPSFTSGKGYTK
ncbi:MAG: hypothetical protein JO131_09550, partial [Gammaproteobacteria bacterium]|nr:hypothetical protein [Gammaproteobacteria bacterium]